MPPLSLKKILAAVAAIVVLAYNRRIIDCLKSIWDWFVTGLEPLRNSPAEARFVLTLLLMALLFITLYRFFMNRGKRDKS